ncbi:PREDICTED: exonuclease 3'-5' domain-containing protein 1 [Cyprinodon variegatus]|uniref:exonuclease 3'-5' domain-containing protein 1 n=1 Tax=Cyprinodon variegatus TaxID=28743 RepID=UPI0007425F75|nr:PREDICTED: exonuclease 3'-5' domain-containing protein 1 [Cyprinodon variegatus]
MVPEDVQFMALLKGKRIKLTLKNASYFGIVQGINSNKTLVLADVSDSSGCRYSGTMLFFGREVLNVELESKEKDDRPIMHGAPEEQLDLERFQSYRKMMSLDDHEEESINFELIDKIHVKFGPAVMHINKEQVIGVGGEGVEIFKNGRLCWLQIATSKKVYLFDILLLGAQAFKNGLSMILESKQILKVIHDCRAIAACLIAQFGVQLTNVFDTQVADVMYFYSKTGVIEETEMWYKRPCPLPLLKVMALSVIHLKRLRLVLLDRLMTDYMVLVDSYLSSSLGEPDGLEYVIMNNVLELPKELRQLDEMRSERQERARKRYPVTEQGLLDRFNPYPDSETTPAADGHSNTQSHSLEVDATPCLSSKMVPPDPLQDPSVSRDHSPDASSEPQKEITTNTHLPATLNEEVKCMMGRGWQIVKEQSSTPFLPSFGRGFPLQKSHPQIPGEGAGGIKAPIWQEKNLCMMALQSPTK